tara:strand:- start:182 stop:532 length:351 start_codon:yes stop_codon:yes gene_type:complete
LLALQERQLLGAVEISLFRVSIKRLRSDGSSEIAATRPPDDAGSFRIELSLLFCKPCTLKRGGSVEPASLCLQRLSTKPKVATPEFFSQEELAGILAGTVTNLEVTSSLSGLIHTE